MQNVLARKLSNAGTLEESDLIRLEKLTATCRQLSPKTDIIGQGDAPDRVHLVMDGVACRYKLLPDGSRSIMALLLPGDFCDLHVAILGQMDHNIGTLTQCDLVDIPRSDIEELLNNYPRIARALWWATLVDEAVLREWLVNMGKRRSDRQMAHLICEVYLRLKSVGRSEDFHLPLTQEQLADTLGITPVHAQRIVATLKQDNLISMAGRAITVPDIHALCAFSGFDPDYLHLKNTTRTLGAFGVN